MNLVTQILVTFFSRGLGAGIITFVLKALNADPDFLRSKLEALYLSVHTWTEASTLISGLLLMGNHEELEKALKDGSDLTEHVG
jgi:hypothetical protein